MKIKSLSLTNFRAFPGPDSTVIKLKGRNLLVYGENGSGKSSVFQALRAFFSTSNSTLPQFLDSEGGANKFSGIADCSIGVEFTDGTAPLIWNQDMANLGVVRSDQRVIEAALRASCLDYRSLLRTSFSHGYDSVNLFDILVGVVLADYPVPVAGGQPRPLLDLYADAEYAIPRRGLNQPDIVSDYAGAFSTVTSHTAMVLAEIERARVAFNHALSDALTVLTPVINGFLSELPVDGLVLDGFAFSGLTYNRGERRFEGAFVEPIVNFRGYVPPRPQLFLNEARLSAMALAVYFAGRHHVVPQNADYDARNLPVPLKLLVLDDVLIGLDMANRIPVLKILESSFSEWQIVLLTHDYTWYDMVRMTVESSEWTICEMYPRFDIDSGYDRPIVRVQGTGWGDLIRIAEEHLANGDRRASAVYARAAFEVWLKKKADKTGGVKVQFKLNPAQLTSADLWDALYGRVTTPSGPQIVAKQNLELARKVVLNAWSHGGGSNVTDGEVQAAIDAVKAVAREFTVIA